LERERDGVLGFRKSALQIKIRDLDESELEELELASDVALGRVEPKLP